MRESIARYRIVGTLGRGSMGQVYLADDPLLNRRVAIKEVAFADDGGTQEALHERVLRDAKAVANLSHPNIVNVHDVVEEGGSAFIVMEYIEGETLSAHLRRMPVPDPAFAVQVLRQIAAALDYAHGKGVIHRDVKPGNVMLSPSGTAKIVDFGIARMMDTRTNTPTGFVVGTAAYMPPEQFTMPGVDGRADQYSLAAVAYEMLTGKTLFGTHPVTVLAYKAVHEIPQAASARNASLPAPVDTALTKALAKTPEGRFATCTEFVGALDQAISTPTVRLTPADDRPTQTLAIPTVAIPPVAVPASAPKPANSGMRWVAGLSVVLLAGAAGLAIWKPWARTTEPVASVTPAPSAVTEPVPAPVKASEPPKPVVVEPAGVQTEPLKEVVPAKTKSEKPPEPEPVKEAQSAVGELFKKGQEQLKAGDYQGTIASFSSVIAQQPKRPMAYYYRGQAHQYLFQNEAAVSDYNEAIRYKPEDPFPYIGRGVCLVRLHRDEDALADFNRALEIRGDLVAALNGRGGILMRRRQFEPAIRDFTAAIAANPRAVQAYRSRAAAKLAMGDLAGARKDRKAAEGLKNGEP